MEAKKEIRKKLGNLEYFFSFLSSLDPNTTREDFFDASKIIIQAALEIADFESAKDAFNKMLSDFAEGKKEYQLFVRRNYRQNQGSIRRLTFLMEESYAAGLYTDIDCFLQAMFAFSDDMIRTKLFALAGRDKFLSEIYAGKVSEPIMAHLLRRNLTHAMLRKWDEGNDKTVSHVTMTGDEKPMQLPPAHSPEIYVREKAFKTLEEGYVQEKWYTRAEGDAIHAIVASSSGDTDGS